MSNQSLDRVSDGPQVFPRFSITKFNRAFHKFCERHNIDPSEDTFRAKGGKPGRKRKEREDE